jgi:cold shock CspA family protein
MSTGEITRIVRNRGLGFIRQAGEKNELRFYLESVALKTRGLLAEGKIVEFEKEDDYGDEGASPAVNVRLAGREIEPARMPVSLGHPTNGLVL